MVVRFPARSTPPSLHGSSTYWFDNGSPPIKCRAEVLAERVSTAEAVIDKYPAWRRSWCSAEAQKLREQLPELAQSLTETELVEHVENKLSAAFEQNWPRR